MTQLSFISQEKVDNFAMAIKHETFIHLTSTSIITATQTRPAIRHGIFIYLTFTSVSGATHLNNYCLHQPVNGKVVVVGRCLAEADVADKAA
jgi:hypothetical protein